MIIYRTNLRSSAEWRVIMLSHFAGILDGIIGLATLGFLSSGFSVACSRVFMDLRYPCPDYDDSE